MQTSSEDEQNSALSAQAELSIDRNIAAQSCADSAQAIGQSETQQPQENAVSKEDRRQFVRQKTTEYIKRTAVLIIGLIIMSFGVGVSLEVTANVTTLAGEGLSLAMCQLFPKIKFGYMKVIVDCSFVVIAVALSFIFLQRLAAVREGTVAAALLVGIIAKTLNRFIVPLGKKFFLPRQKQSDKTQGNNKNEDKKEA